MKEKQHVKVCVKQLNMHASQDLVFNHNMDPLKVLMTVKQPVKLTIDVIWDLLHVSKILMVLMMIYLPAQQLVINQVFFE